MKKQKFDFKEISEFLKTPKGKSMAFFGFYFLFFLVLMILARAGGTSRINTEYQQTKPYSISFKKIVKGNYHFKYEIKLDENSFLYEGNKNGVKELFLVGNETFYRNDDIFLKESLGVWVKDDNPYMMSEFINIDSIQNIINNATYISKTDYESGMKVYDFQITTNTLVKLFENIDIDIDDIPNEIVVKTDDLDNVNSIKFYLNSYTKYKNFAFNLGEVDLNYDQFGEIEDIKEPE